MIESPSVAGFLSRAAQQCGFEREKFVESKIPGTFDKVAVIMFFGDYRGMSIMSMLLLKPFIDKILKDKYIILCSHSGAAGIFPYVDEYWAPSDGMAIADLLNNASGFFNFDKRLETFGIQLRRHFHVVFTEDDFLGFYDEGLTTAFFDKFGKVERFLPSLPPWRGGEIDKALRLRSGKGVFLYPSHSGKLWDRGKEISVNLPRDFWVNLTEKLLSKGFTPIVYHNQVSHDISPDFGERCLYVADRSLTGVLAVMRSSGCVIDVFSGISRLAVVARCPFLAVDERQRYVKSKEFEINDLCINRMYPYRYVFSFPTVVEGGNFTEVADHICAAASDFVPLASKSHLPPASESYDEVSYDSVRSYKVKRLGAHFIKVEKLVVPASYGAN